VGRLLIVENDVENGVQAVRTPKRAAQGALGNDERVGLFTAAVEHAWDQAAFAQATGLARSQRMALLHLETNSFPGHGGGL